MKVESREDGTLTLSERLPVLRWGSLVSGVALAATLVVVQQAPLRLSPVAFAGAALVTLLALALAAFVPDRSFRFEPVAGHLHWSVMRLFGSREGVLPFADISAVILQASAQAVRRRHRAGYRVVLVTSIGHLPLSSVEEFDRATCERVSEQIRATLAAHDEALPEAAAA